MSEWTCRKLGELITVKHGFAFKGEYFGDDPAGPILVTPGNFAIGGGFRKAKVKSYSGPIPEGFVLSAGDLVVTMTDLSKAADALGYPALIPEGLTYLHNQRIGKIEILDATQLDKGFLQYALRVDAYRRHVVNGATGTTVKHTSPTRICEYVISLPSLPEQRAIASLLGALDDKIAINERIVRTCRELAGALFQQAVLNPEAGRCRWVRSPSISQVSTYRRTRMRQEGLMQCMAPTVSWDGIPHISTREGSPSLRGSVVNVGLFGGRIPLRG